MTGGRPHRQRPEGFDERAPHMTTAEMRKEWACGNDAILRWLAEIGIKRAPTRAQPIPDGFADVAAHWTSADLQRHFGLSEHVVTRMRKVLGIDVRHRGNAMAIPDGFPSVARTMSGSFLCERFGVGMNTIRRWRNELGIVVQPGRRGVIRAPGTHSIEDSAANYLRRTAPVWRCRSDGQFDHRGNNWRFGRAVLTGEDLIERARRKGFDPDAWRRIGA